MTMPPLRAHDAQAILEALQAFDRARDGDELMHTVLVHLERLIPSLSASFNWMADGRLDYVLHPPLPAELENGLMRVMERNWRENPLVAYLNTHDDHRVLRWRDVVDLEQWFRSALYKEFYAPLGITDQLALRLPSPLGVVAGLVVNGAHDFDERDTAVFSHVAHHVAWRLGAVSEGMAMRTALDGLGWLQISVDSQGRILGSPPIELAPLVGADCRVIPHVQDLINDSTPGTFPDSPQVIVTPGGSFRAIVARNAIPPHALFVYVVDGDLRADQLFALTEAGLSRRESEVAAALRDGATNSAIAAQLGISVGTVKKHVERIFRVLDVHNRTAAANAIGQLLDPQSYPP